MTIFISKYWTVKNQPGNTEKKEVEGSVTAFETEFREGEVVQIPCSGVWME
jgi:hypothetical protein